MVIGKMREVVVFLQNTPTPNEGGGFTDVYTTLVTTRGQLIDKSGNRALSFSGIVDNTSMTLLCRFQTTLAAGLRSDTKIVISGITYTFTHYRLKDQRKHLYEFDIQMQSN